MRKRVDEGAPTWPEVMALACPECARAFPLRGVRPDGGLLFHCTTHLWFCADSWTSDPSIVNTHRVEDRHVDPATRIEFIRGALSVVLRASGRLPAVVLQSMVPDNSMQFVSVPEGDGDVVASVSSRRKPCNRCATRPLDKAHEDVLIAMGFGPLESDEPYIAGGLPADPTGLTAVAEVVFHDVFEENPGVSLWAIFDEPALAEVFYLAWSFRP